MSRSGYDEEYDGWALIRWRGAVNSAIKGKRGQAFLRELLTALDALPEPRLISHELQDGNGEVCAIGSVGIKRGIEMQHIDVESTKRIGEIFGIPRALVAEIEFVNDNDFGARASKPEEVFLRVRAWVVEHLAIPNTGEQT